MTTSDQYAEKVWPPDGAREPVPAACAAWLATHAEWVPIPGFSRYVVSHRGGGVRRHGLAGALLKVRIGTHGYPETGLYNDAGKQEKRTMHSLVLLGHAGPPPEGMETRHLHDNRLDYRYCGCGTGACTQGEIRYGTREENLDDWRAAHPPRPKPVKLCVRCSGPFTGNGKRCHPCVVAIGEDAAVLLRGGMPLGEVAERLEYPSTDGVHTLAVKYGGYGIERPRWTQRVTATLRGLFPGGDVE